MKFDFLFKSFDKNRYIEVILKPAVMKNQAKLFVKPCEFRLFDRRIVDE